MDAEQFEFFKERYSRMSDEELANLLIGRHERLSDEANVALSVVLEQKDPAAFSREIREKVSDLNTQAQAAAQAVQKQQEHNKRARRALLVFFIAVAVIFGVVTFLR